MAQSMTQGDYCDRCMRMFSTTEGLQALGSEIGYEHHTTVSIKESAASGCRLCQIILPGWGRLAEERERLVFRAYSNHRPCWKAMAESGSAATAPFMLDNLTGYGYRDGQFQGWVIELTVFTAANDIAAAWLPKRPVVTDVGSKFALSTVKQWLEECQEDHPTCPRPVKPKLPTRVVDVGAEGETGRVKLYVSHASEHGEYAVLSYCWGGPQPILTLKENLVSMTNGLPIHKLPQTILDAIKVTRNLNIKYLWIDALCIIQDSDEDKGKEIDLMGQIYKNATVTIAASSAKSVSEGFLQTRIGPEYLTLPFLCPDNSLGNVFVMREFVHDVMHPLNKRGWTLQESLLSPRKLLFGESELAWYCQAEKNRQFPGSPIKCFYMFGILPPEVFQKDGEVQMDPPKAHSVWGDVINEYTKRSLTFREDRLRALAGVTNELAPIFQDKCTFGIWHRNFLRQIIWSGSPSVDDDTSGDLLNCAPGWSWASVYNSVHFWSFEPYNDISWELQGEVVVIEAKLRKGNDIDPPQTNSWRYSWDAPSPESGEYIFATTYKGQEVYYLHFGYEPGMEHRQCLMILVAAGKGSFRRVGLVRTFVSTTAFNDCQKRSIRII